MCQQTLLELGPWKEWIQQWIQQKRQIQIVLYLKHWKCPVNVKYLTKARQTQLFKVELSLSTLLSYLCVHHCPWNSGCNCLQRCLYQPRKEWDTTTAKIELWEGSDLVSGNFWKMVYSNLGWVGFTCALPAYWHGAAAKVCKTEHTKSTNVHTRKHTTSCAKPSRQDDPASTPLHAHLTFVLLPFFPCFPNTHWDVHICSYFGLCKGSPPCPEAPTVNLRFAINVPKCGHS